MKLFKIKRISDQAILFIQQHESIQDVQIPSGWDLHLEHQIQSTDQHGVPLFDENEDPIMETVEATCEIIEEEIVPLSYQELRKIQYQKRVDPLLAEAITDKEAGDSTKMIELLAIKAAIKLEIPSV